jgi:Tol biopolymer transport system component
MVLDMKKKVFLLPMAVLLVWVSTFGQSAKESLLSKTENAYNPIPSPDGSMIAYVRTGWGRDYPFMSWGRINLITEVRVMDSGGRILTEKPLADTFLGGWTPDGKNLVCYRDYKYFLVSLDGTRSRESQIPYEQWSTVDKADRGAYVPGLDSVVFVQHLYKPATGVIRTVEKVVARNEASHLGQMLVPSPNGRYIAAIDVTRWADDLIWVYDTRNETWANLGKATVHPDIIYPNNDWDWMGATWNPWFADSSRLAFISGQSIVISTPDGNQKQTLAVPAATIGLATPSPDGKLVAYVTFDPEPNKEQAQWTFWGNTTIWVVPIGPGPRARALTNKSPEAIYDLRWLNNNEIVFDRSANDSFYNNVRLWKVHIE